LLLQSVWSVVFLIAFVSLAAFGFRSRARWMDRQWQAAEQEAHRRVKHRLQEVLQTVPGAQLVAVQRVVSSSWRGVRAQVCWTATGTVYELWFPRAYMLAGDSLAIVGADPSTGRVELRNVLARATADPVVDIEQG
jgi:hypothetical protein